MGIRVRLIAMFGDGELPNEAVEIGTVDVPVECAVTEDRTDPLRVTVVPDLSVFEQLTEFRTAEEDRDPKADALDAESDRLANESKMMRSARDAVYADPCAREPVRAIADRRVTDARNMRFVGR